MEVGIIPHSFRILSTIRIVLGGFDVTTEHYEPLLACSPSGKLACLSFARTFFPRQQYYPYKLAQNIDDFRINDYSSRLRVQRSLLEGKIDKHA